MGYSGIGRMMRERAREGRARSRCRCGKVVSPVPVQLGAGASPVLVQMWERGEPSPGADVGGERSSLVNERRDEIACAVCDEERGTVIRLLRHAKAIVIDRVGFRTSDRPAHIRCQRKVAGRAVATCTPIIPRLYPDYTPFISPGPTLRASFGAPTVGVGPYRREGGDELLVPAGKLWQRSRCRCG